MVQTGAEAQAALEQATLNWEALVRIAIIVALCIGAFVLLKRLKGRLTAYLQRRDEEHGRDSRDVLLTLVPLGESIIRFLILTSGLVGCLSAVNISFSPFVYCLGFLSAGFALGAQDTFKDIIRGVLTLAEGKLSVGDKVSINGKKGRVETMTIRQITIRHSDGSVEAFPFSQVGTIRNFSMGDTVMASTFRLASDADARVFAQFAQEVLDVMREEKPWKKFISKKTAKTPEFDFQSVSNAGVTVAVILKVRNDPSGEFESEFNRRMWEKLKTTTMLRRG